MFAFRRKTSYSRWGKADAGIKSEREYEAKLAPDSGSK